MKPSKPVARASDYEFHEVPHAEGAALIKEHHYAKGCSKTGRMFGMYREGRLVGVSQWLPPTKVAAQSVLPDYDLWKRVISLTRLVVVPGEPQNAASMLIARGLKWISSLRLGDTNRRAWLAAVTWADESQGHTGAIYKATNWACWGVSGSYPRWVDSEGRQVATKAGPKTRTSAEMQALGYTMVGKYKKLKFVRFFA